jgi:hypothetical protein
MMGHGMGHGMGSLMGDMTGMRGRAARGAA